MGLGCHRTGITEGVMWFRSLGFWVQEAGVWWGPGGHHRGRMGHLVQEVTGAGRWGRLCLEILDWLAGVCGGWRGGGPKARVWLVSEG